MDTSSRKENASKQANITSVPIQSERKTLLGQSDATIGRIRGDQTRSTRATGSSLLSLRSLDLALKPQKISFRHDTVDKPELFAALCIQSLRKERQPAGPHS